jgi:pimeloyl-ACP methyl ester carboxylesterase
VLGVGIGAVIALELAQSEPHLVTEAILVEPPLFGLIPAATEGMSADVTAIREAAEDGGKEAAYDLFLSGGLPVLGSGAGRLAERADRGPLAPHTFLVETPAVPAWPLDPQRLAALEAGVRIATTPSAPPLLVEAAGLVAARIPGAEQTVTTGEGAGAVAELLKDL